MIKINLIKARGTRTRKINLTPSVSSIGLVYAVVLVLALGSLFGYGWMIHRQVSSLTEKQTELKAEDAKLQEKRKKLTELENLKKTQQDRIAVIEKLKEAQTGPVLLMNHIIKSIPPNSQMWLSSLDQKGERVNIKGFAARSQVLPDFMVNLSAGALFKSVELELIQEEKDAAKFSLICLTANQPLQAE